MIPLLATSESARVVLPGGGEREREKERERETAVDIGAASTKT